MKKILSFLLVGFLPTILLFSQTAVLSVNLPERVTVCDSSAFTVEISNPTGSDLNNVKILIELPGNLVYRLGTITGAAEDNISNLSNPVFSVSDIGGGLSATLEFYVFADCDVFTAINSNTIFTTKISADFTGGNAEVTSEPFAVETPFLVITKNQPRLMEGSRGAVFQREIEVKNTRLGALRSFRYRNTYQSGIIIKSALGANQSTALNVYEHILDGADFQQIGDGDALFEFNESITIIENIEILSCGNDLSFAKSKVEVDWGCRGTFCQKNETSGFVRIEKNDNTPELIFEPVAVAPTDCFCGSGGEITQSLKITNVGTDDALNISLVINQDTTEDAALLPGTFQMDSAGSIFPISDVTPFVLSGINRCSVSETAYEEAVVRIPRLKTGAMITVLWKTAFCQQACEQKKFNRWTLETSYNTICPPPDDQTISEEFLVTSEQTEGTGNIEVSEASPGPAGTFSSLTDMLFWMKNSRLERNGTMTVTLSVNEQIHLVSPDFRLNGIEPISISSRNTSSGTTYFLDYQLPFLSDSAGMNLTGQIFCDSIADLLPPCRPELSTACIDPCIEPIDPPPTFPVTAVVQYFVGDNCEPECVPTTCLTANIAPACPQDSICVIPIDGHVEFDFSAERENIGFLDNDNNRRADAPSPADRSQIRTDRFIPGDTLVTEFEGWVIGNIPNFGATGGEASIQFSNIGPLDVSRVNEDFYIEGLDMIETMLEIFDESTGERFVCFDIPFRKQVLPNLGAYIFDFSIAEVQSNCALPSGFVYEHGDSILLTVRHRFMKNLREPEGWSGNPPSIQLNAFSSMRIYNAPEEYEFYCRCAEQQLELSNYDFELIPKEYGVAPCGVSDFSTGDLFRIRLAEGNFFPYEVRPLVRMTDYIIEPDLPIDIQEFQLASLNLQGAGNIFERENLLFVKNGKAFEVDLLPYQTDPILDEGFFMFIKYRLDSDCTLDGKSEVDFLTNLSFQHEFPGVPKMLLLAKQLNAFNVLAPDLRITSLFPDINSNDRFGRWDLEVFNKIKSLGDVKSGDALNAFLYVNTQNDVFPKFDLLNTSTGELVPQSNGVFQIGDLPPDERFPYQLIGESLSCENEKLTVHFGWNCEPLTDSLEAASVCFKSSLDLELQVLPGEIESILDTTRISGDLCDTLPFFTIEIFNAELGSLYDVFLEVTLPPGVQVAAGTSEIAHPNNVSFVKIGDPENIGGGFYKWNFTDLNDSLALRGLPSVLSAPSNSLILRFRTVTDCSFIAESFPVFSVGGFQNCTKRSNTRARAVKPISINGVSPPYGMGVSADDPVFGNCDDEAVLNFKLTPDAIPDNRDSVLLTLPPGLSFIAGSYIGNSNAPTGSPIIENTGTQEILKWLISPTLAPGNQMEMQVRVRGLLQLDCERELINLQSVTTTNALCVASGENCDIRVQTGGLFIPLDIIRPDLSLTNFNAEIISQNGIDRVIYSVQVNNSAGTGSSPVKVRFYRDTDGDGLISGVDVLVHSDSLIVSGGFGVLSGGFFAEPEDICGLLAVVDADENCSCEGDVIALPVKIKRNFSDNYITCSGVDVQIGVPVGSGSSYQWVPSDNLSCTDCPQADFSFENDSPIPLDFNYQLIENNSAGCIVENNFVVTVRPKPDILIQNNQLCSGDCIILETTDGTVAVWSGPGITDPNDPTPEVCPPVTSEFTAMVSDTFGCSSSAKIIIEVLPLPAVDAGEDVDFCPGQSLTLNGSVESGSSSVWSPVSAVSNPGSLTPQILVNQSTVLTLTAVSIAGCENSDDISVNIIDTAPLLVSPSQTTICGNAEAILTASGVTDYEWSPGRDLLCPDCPVITVMPEDTTTYTVIGSFDGLCPDTAFVTVMVVDTFKTADTLRICEGESEIIFGNEETESGDYQSPLFLTSGGCDSVHITTLIVAPGPDLSDITISSDTTVRLGDSVQLSLNIPPEIDVNLLTFEWSPADLLSCNTCQNPKAGPQSELEIFSVTITDENGCSVELRTSIEVTETCEVGDFKIPNIFSPNGDGINDEFKPFGDRPGAVPDFVWIRVFDRWGEKVYEGRGEDAGWDGNYNGKEAVSDVYVYLIQLGCGQQESGEIKEGDVTLYR